MAHMTIDIRRIAGKEEALEGLSLSYNKNPKEMEKVAKRLFGKDLGENKFLEMIYVWIKIKAPREWWQQFDAYRMRCEQSESTMHTLLKKELTTENFIDGVDQRSIDIVNEYIQKKDLISAKKNLPEGFLQTRMICLNYKSIKNIVLQRCNHKLPEWHLFVETMLDKLPNLKEWLKKEEPERVCSSRADRCRICGSCAINPHLYGRIPDKDLDLCDVCYWKSRAY